MQLITKAGNTYYIVNNLHPTILKLKYDTNLWAATAMGDERKVDFDSFPPKPPPSAYS